MPTRRSATVAVALIAASLALPTVARPTEPPPAVSAAPITSPQDAYDRLSATVDAFDALVNRIDAEVGRKDTDPKLFVTFGWVARWNGPWPGDFAPKEDFLKLNERVFNEATRLGLPAAFAQVAGAKAMAFPPPRADMLATLKIPALRGLFEAHEFAFNRELAAGRPIEAAGVVATHLGVARLLLDGTGSAAQVGSLESRRVFTVLMPLIADAKLDAKTRAALATSIAPVPLNRAQRIDREVAYISSGFPSQWAKLPKELFTSGPGAAKAWDDLDETGKIVLSNYFGARPAFPLPTAEAMAGEVKAAGERLKGWAALPMLEIRQQARKLTEGNKSPGAAREERLINQLAKSIQNAEEAALAVDGLRVALALEAFKDAKGDYPMSLDELVPAHLPSVPADPAKPGTTLIYKRGSVKLWDKNYPYVLYSRGSDGADDNATTLREPSVTLSGVSVEKGKDVVLNAHHEK